MTIERVRMTTTHIARGLLPKDGGNPLRHALGDAGLLVSAADRGYVILVENGEAARYHHSEQLGRLIAGMESGANLRPVTLLIDRKARSITFRAEERPPEGSSRLGAHVPDSYMDRVEAIARERGESPSAAALRAVTEMVMRETVHRQMPEFPDTPLCLAGYGASSPEEWENTPRQRRCPECVRYEELEEI